MSMAQFLLDSVPFLAWERSTEGRPLRGVQHTVGSDGAAPWNCFVEGVHRLLGCDIK